MRRLATHSPSVILGVEQEVRAHDGDAHRHDAQDDQDQHHEAVHVVDLVGPERREDEVPAEGGQRTRHRGCRDRLAACKSTAVTAHLHFNENGAEWKDSSKADDDGGLHEPERSQHSACQYDFIHPQCLHQTATSGAADT